MSHSLKVLIVSKRIAKICSVRGSLPPNGYNSGMLRWDTLTQHQPPTCVFIVFSQKDASDLKFLLPLTASRLFYTRGDGV